MGQCSLFKKNKDEKLSIYYSKELYIILKQNFTSFNIYTNRLKLLLLLDEIYWELEDDYIQLKNIYDFIYSILYIQEDLLASYYMNDINELCQNAVISNNLEKIKNRMYVILNYIDTDIKRFNYNTSLLSEYDVAQKTYYICSCYCYLY